MEGSEINILLVEENPKEAEYIRDLLTKGYERPPDLPTLKMTHASTLARAPELLSHQSVDLILLSVPGTESQNLDALEHAQLSAPSIPVIVLNGHFADGADHLVKDHLDGYNPFHTIIRAIERGSVLKRLNENEKRFRALIENSADQVSILAPDSTLLYENPSVNPVLGYSPGEFLGQSMFQLVHPDDLPHLQNRFAQLVQDAELRPREQFRLQHRDGSWRWVEAVGTNMLAEPSVRGIVINYHDITERRRADLERQVMLEIMQGLVSTNSLQEFLQLIHRLIARVIYAENFLVVFHHKSSGLFEEVYAVDQYDAPMPSSRLEKSITSYVFRSAEPLLLNQTRFDELVALGEVELVGTDSVAWLGVPLTMPNEVIGVMAVQNYEELDCYSERDKEFLASVGAQVALAIDRKQSEETIRKAEEKHRALVEQLPMILYANPADDVGSTTYVSPQVNEILGYTREEWLQDPQFWQKVLHPEDYKSVIQFVESLDPNGQPVDLEYRMIARDGRIVWFRDQGILVRDAAGQPSFWQGLMTDITERKQAEKRIRQQVERLAALREIDRVITSSFDMQLTLDILLSRTIAILGVDAATVLLLNPLQFTLEYAADIGFRTKAAETACVRVGESYAGRAALEECIVQIPNLEDDPNNLFLTGLLKGEGFVSYYGAPLIIKGKVVGVLEVFNRTVIERDQEWLDFLSTLAGQAALAIDNAKLFEDLQHSNQELSLAYEATIEGWSRALDLRDKETEGHTQRVTELTMQLARTMGMDERTLVHIRRGSLLHDIGKMGVPDHILLKPGSLTEEEWAQMKKHPQYARDMLEPIKFLHPVLDIPYCHHEKWDGTGYPRGLKGDQIPLAARIFSVVDVWDALTSDRPYRPGWSKAKALEYIKEQSGEHFDPEVVERFLRLIGDKSIEMHMVG